MKKIKLTKGEYALVDGKDFKWLNQWKWYCSTNPQDRKQAARTERRKWGKRKMVLMSRQIMSVVNSPSSVLVDHVSLNTLDNRRSNLRISTMSLNQANRNKQKNNTSTYKGVCYKGEYKKLGCPKWVAQIGVNKEIIYLGHFKNKKDAAMAYNQAALKYFGEFAKLNNLYGVYL